MFNTIFWVVIGIIVIVGSAGMASAADQNKDAE